MNEEAKREFIQRAGHYILKIRKIPGKARSFDVTTLNGTYRVILAPSGAIMSNGITHESERKERLELYVSDATIQAAIDKSGLTCRSQAVAYCINHFQPNK